MAYMQTAMTDFRVKAFIGKLELGLQEFISQNNLDKPALVRNLFTSDPTAADSDSLPVLPARKRTRLTPGPNSWRSCTWSPARKADEQGPKSLGGPSSGCGEPRTRACGGARQSSKSDVPAPRADTPQGYVVSRKRIGRQQKWRHVGTALTASV